ncbi:hypothetical protein PG993_015263 [Apiospora rasikravindrae]|uniref:Uncharacterized protein n=1 Tax=Apiospora rasikravindrae TaxID=990691 RepID=A0ABR1RR98_9PEZI
MHFGQDHLDAQLLQPGDVGWPVGVHGNATGRRGASLGQDVGERHLVDALGIAEDESMASRERLVERRVVGPGELVGSEVHVPTDEGDPPRRRRRPGRRLDCWSCRLEKLGVGLEKWGACG